MRAVITVIGKDMVGIMAKVSDRCAKANANILEVTQSILQDLFAMIMLVDLSRCSIDIASVRSQLDAVAAEMGMELHLTREEVFDAMHHI